MTLTHLQSVASNYNVSYNVDVRFRSLAEESQAVAQAVNRSQAAVQGELAQLKAWVRKLQHRSRKVDKRLRALGLTLGERSQQQARERKAHEAQGDALQDSLARLEGLVHSQGARLAALEGWLPVAHPGTTALGPALVPAPTQPGLLGPSSLKLQRDRQELQAASEHRGPRQDSSAPLQGTREPPGSGSHRVLNETATAPKDPPRQAWSPRGPGESKYHRLPVDGQASLQLLLRPGPPENLPFSKEIQLRARRWGEGLGSSGWAHCHHRDFLRGGRRNTVRGWKQRWREAQTRGPHAKGCRRLWKLERAGDGFSLSLQRNQPCPHLI